jgi:hypothetical protein
MEKLASKRIIRFYKNYIHWPKEEIDGNIWPIDRILKDVFDPIYQVRLFFKTSSTLSGSRSKVSIFNAESIWRWFKSSNSIINPFTGKKMSKCDFTKIAKKVFETKIATESEIKHTTLQYFPQNNDFKSRVAEDIEKLITAGVKNDRVVIEKILTKRGPDIDNDRFFPDTFIEINTITFKSSTLYRINLIMTIALKGDLDLFCYACSMGCDPCKVEESTQLNAFHIAALTGKIDILNKITFFNGDITQTSSCGSVVDILLENGLFDELYN